MKNILKWFRLVTIIEMENTIKTIITKYLNEIEELKNLFKEPVNISFEVFKKENGIENIKTGDWNRVFNEYYDLHCRKQYQAYRLRKLSLDPHILNVFMNKFASFDWESVRSYMEKLNGVGKINQLHQL